MGKASRDKGQRGERELAHALGGKRVPLSGAQEGFPGDVTALGMLFECKVRRDGFRQLYEWLDGADALGIKADRKRWLIVLPIEKFLALSGVRDRDGEARLP